MMHAPMIITNLVILHRPTHSSVSLPLMGPSPMSYSCMLMGSYSGQLGQGEPMDWAGLQLKLDLLLETELISYLTSIHLLLKL